MSRTPDDSRSAGEPEPLSADLARSVDAGQGGGADLDRLYAQLRTELAREQGMRGWLRARSTLARGLSAFAVVAIAGALAGLGFARPDLDSYPPVRLSLSLSAMAALMVVGMALALRPLQRPALPSWAAPVLVGGALGLLAGLYLIAPLEAPQSAFDPRVLAPALACMGVGLALGIPVYGVLWLLDRGGARRALPMAVAAGLAANLVLHIHCPSAQPSHLMMGHFGAAVLLLLAIALWASARD